MSFLGPQLEIHITRGLTLLIMLQQGISEELLLLPFYFLLNLGLSRPFPLALRLPTKDGFQWILQQTR